MSNRDDIDKLNEQIKNLQNNSKDELDESREVIIDKKYEYDETDDGNTKRVETIEEIEELEENEDTKEIKVVEETEKETKNDENNTLDDDTKNEDLTSIESSQDIARVDDNVDETTNKVNGKKNNTKITIGVIIGILVVIIIILLLFVLKKDDTKDKNNKKDKSSTSVKIDEKKVLEGYGDALKGIVGVYYTKQKVLLEYDDAIKLVNYDYDVKCSEHEIYEDGSIYLNKCTIDDKKINYSYGEKQEKKEPQVSEGAIKVYVSKKDNIATLVDVKNKDDYDVYSFDIDGKYTDLNLFGSKSDYVFYMDEEYKVHMINYKTGARVLDFMNYDSVLPIKYNDDYDQKYIAINVNNKWGIYNLTNNERVVAHKYNGISPTLSMGVGGPQVFAGSLDDGVVAVVEDGYYGILNYRDGKEIIKTEYKTMLRSGEYLLSLDAYGDYHIFDVAGNEYLEDKFDNIYWAVDGKYILVKDGKDVKIVTIKGKEIYNYGEIEVGSINYGLNYKNGALFQFSNPKAGGENAKDGCIEIIYDSVEKNGEVKTSYCGGIAKPILYLYPKKTTKVTVSFEHPEFLQTTYPKFNGSWKVTAKSNGDLYDKNNKYYYGLYWDEAKVHSVDFSTGFYVTKDNAIEFLEKKLDYIGLSDREANEFIMYWLPILEKNEKSLVYFELTEERESYNKINITPKPDSLLRLVIHIKKVDKKVEIPKQKLTRFQREGFVAVEWGGTTY